MMRNAVCSTGGILVAVRLSQMVPDEVHRRRRKILGSHDDLLELFVPIEVGVDTSVVGPKVSVGREDRRERREIASINGQGIPLAQRPDREHVSYIEGLAVARHGAQSARSGARERAPNADTRRRSDAFWGPIYVSVFVARRPSDLEDDDVRRAGLGLEVAVRRTGGRRIPV